MRVATYNVHDCIGRDRRYDPGRVATVVQALKADIVALQEITLDHAGDLLADLEAITGMRGLDGTVFARGIGRYGNLLLTRHEILESHRHDLATGGREPRGALDATLATDIGPVRVLATHLGLARSERREQLAMLAEQTARGPHATILAGDLNVWRGKNELAELQAQGMTHRPVASFPVWPRPLLALDRILVREPLQIKACWRHAGDGAQLASDHYPVVADLRFSPTCRLADRHDVA